MRGARSAGSELQLMRIYALQQTRTLLRRFAYEVNQTARVSNADSIHDLRVSIRRLQQCLRVFRQYLPKHEAKRVRRKLKALMSLAAKVRDNDIALELLRASGTGVRSRLAAMLANERKQEEKELLAAVRRASGDSFSRKWRSRLEL